MILAIIQARMRSLRLPGKVLFRLGDKTVLEGVVERIKKSKLVEETIVATTLKKEDLKIASLCSAKGIRVYRGSEDDVLDRYFQAAKLLKPDHIVRITADCPFIDHKIVDKTIRLHLSKRADYTSNTIKETFPDGEDVEVFTFKALKATWKNARLRSEREHVTPYMKKHPGTFKIENLECGKDFSQKRWTLDEKKDYEFMKIIYANLHKKNSVFGMDEIIGFINRHPEYEKINRGIKRNEGYSRSLREDRVVKPERRKRK
jgi:spore coat polysaccharide biosynthesis protein SpsF (cytidylyltransferase family)